MLGGRAVVLRGVFVDTGVWIVDPFAGNTGTPPTGAIGAATGGIIGRTPVAGIAPFPVTKISNSTSKINLMMTFFDGFYFTDIRAAIDFFGTSFKNSYLNKSMIKKTNRKL